MVRGDVAAKRHTREHDRVSRQNEWKQKNTEDEPNLNLRLDLREVSYETQRVTPTNGSEGKFRPKLFEETSTAAGSHLASFISM